MVVYLRVLIVVWWLCCGFWINVGELDYVNSVACFYLVVVDDSL